MHIWLNHPEFLGFWYGKFFFLLRNYIRKNDLSRFKELVTYENANSVNYDDRHWTPLHYAAAAEWNRQDNPDLLKYLVTECNANTGATTRSGNTPLHLAVSQSLQNSPNIAIALIDFGGTIHIKNENENTALDRRLCTTFALNPFEPVICRLLDSGAVLPKDAFVPHWVTTFAYARHTAREVAIVIIGIRKYRYSKILHINNIDIARLIGMFVWNSRLQLGMEIFDVHLH